MRSDEHGFTLLETLVALVVLGSIVLGLAQGLRFGLAAWDRQAAIIDRDAALDTTYRLLRTLIEGMAPGTEQGPPAMTGSRAQLAFTAELPAGAPGPTRLADLLLGVDDGHRLLLRWKPHMHARLLASASSEETSVLLGGVAGISLSYYRPARDGHSAVWSDQWRGTDLPALVRMHVVFVDPARNWPDLIAAPGLSPDLE